MMISYNNGEYAFTNQITIPVDNLAYNRSFGVFDFMRMENGVVLFMNDYLERFHNSQKFLFGKAPYSKTSLKEIIDTLIELNKMKESTFKFILSANIVKGKMEPHLVVINAAYNEYASHYFTQGTSLLEKNYVREFSEYKTLNYMASFQNFEKMKKTSSVDVLFHHNNQISEASRSNIFMIKKGKIFTVQNDILNGITRKAIIRGFKGSLKVNVKDIAYDELLQADELFISSTLKKVMPIVQVGSHSIGNGRVGPITKNAIGRFEEICKNYIKKNKKPELGA